MANISINFETWLLNCGDRIYSYLVYKKMFTPYEQQKAFSDESIYEDSHYELCKIEEAVNLGDGEWLLGLRTIGDDGKIYGMIHYYKLSEIRLSLFEHDQLLELYKDEEDSVDEN